jgi:hypothetical protein
MKKALIALATATLGLATVVFPQAAQAGVSVVFSSDYPVVHPVPQVLYPAPRVIYPAPQVIYPSYPSPRDYYRARKRHYRDYGGYYGGRTVEYRRHDDRRDGYYGRGYEGRGEYRDSYYYRH